MKREIRQLLRNIVRAIRMSWQIDRRLVSDEGRIIESGTRRALMKKKGLYREKFSKRAKGYK